MDLTVQLCLWALLLGLSRSELGTVGGYSLAILLSVLLLVNFLGKFALKGHILCLQETNGLPFEVLTALGTLRPGWQVLHSSCQDVHGLDVGASGVWLFLFALRLLSFVTSNNTFFVPGPNP